MNKDNFKLGFLNLLLIFVVSVIFISSFGVFYFINSRKTTYPTPSPISSPTPSPSFTPTAQPTPSPTFEPIPTLIPTPTPIPQTIQIKGDQNCINKTQEAFNLLKEKDLISYQRVNKYIGIIECVPQGSGMYAWETPPRFAVGEQTLNSDIKWYAGAIVHDAHHSELYHNYLASHPGAAVPDNIWTGKDAEFDCINIQRETLIKVGADQYTLDYLESTKNSNYWETPNRTW